MGLNGLVSMLEWLEQSITSSFQFAVIPVLKILVLCSFGLILASRRVNILPTASRQLLSKLVFSLFLPCLIFTQLGSAVSVQAILEWWFLPVNVVLGAVIGCSLGYVVALIVRPPPQYFNFTVVMIGIGNIGNMPLVIIASICRGDPNPFGLDPTICNTNGIAYISFGQWVGAVIVYTFVYQMLAPPVALPDFDKNKPTGIKVEDANDTIAPLSQMTSVTEYTHSIHVPLIHCQPVPSTLVKVWQKAVQLTNSSLLKSIFQPPVVASVSSPFSIQAFQIRTLELKCLVAYTLLLTGFATLALLLALAIGSVPTFKGLIFEDHSFFFFLSDSLSMLGGAMVPCIMLVLGGNLIGGAGNSALGLRTTVAIVFTRLVLVPPLGLSVVLTANKLGFLPVDDKLFRFVLLMQHSMPTSILAGAVANLRGHGAKEASAILFWEHILAVFSLAVWLMLYINIL